MKVYAQMGYGPGNKVTRAISDHVIDGVILGARDIKPANLTRLLETVLNPGIDAILDLQFYSAPFANLKDASLGHLPSYDYFPNKWVRKHYEIEEGIIKTIEAVFEFQREIPLTRWLSPNIIIDKFDTRETVIATNFLRLSPKVLKNFRSSKPLLLTLGFSYKAILDKEEVDNLLNEVSIWKDRPHGFYLLFAPNEEAWVKKYPYATNALTNLLYLIHSLKRNGYEVVVGYSDYLTPFLLAAGADAGATGWFENLKSFNLKRFSESRKGGRRPAARYSSAPLFNRILLRELKAAEDFNIDVRSNTPYEKEFPGGITNLETQILQHWAAVKTCTRDLIDNDTKNNIDASLNQLEAASKLYDKISKKRYSLSRKSSGEHIPVIINALQDFKKTISPYL